MGGFISPRVPQNLEILLNIGIAVCQFPFRHLLLLVHTNGVTLVFLKVNMTLNILHPFKYPGLRVMSFEKVKNSFGLSAMFTCRDGKAGTLSSQASKMLYKPLGVVYIASNKEPLDQSDCWKLFVQL